jgi:hypothetical protein
MLGAVADAGHSRQIEAEVHRGALELFFELGDGRHDGNSLQVYGWTGFRTQV